MKNIFRTVVLFLFLRVCVSWSSCLAKNIYFVCTYSILQFFSYTFFRLMCFRGRSVFSPVHSLTLVTVRVVFLLPEATELLLWPQGTTKVDLPGNLNLSVWFVAICLALARESFTSLCSFAGVLSCRPFPLVFLRFGALNSLSMFSRPV